MFKLATGLKLAKMATELWKGKPEITGGGGKIIALATKGLIRSKTANFAHCKVVGGVLAVYAMELPTALFLGLSGVILVDWAATLVLRFMTKGPV